MSLAKCLSIMFIVLKNQLLVLCLYYCFFLAGRNINNLRYADDTTMAESEEELKAS